MEPLGCEAVQLHEASGRILREEARSSIDLPLFDNSAMDGFAVRAQDLATATPDNPLKLRLLGEIPAGGTFSGELLPGACVRLFTGSPLPRGADAVIMQEESRSSAEPGFVSFLGTVKPWENLRFRGEDIKKDSVLARNRERLQPGQIAALAATGVSQVRVGHRPRVGLISTGNELREAGEVLSENQVFESNRATLASLVSAAGGIPKLFPLVRDDLELVRTRLLEALTDCDSVITSGGVSVGDWDFIKPAIESIGGRIEFWQIAMKPGKPFVFAKHQGKLIFGLPGNPVSAFVTFLLLVRPALLRMQGAKECKPASSPGTLGETFSNRADRRHFMRVTIDRKGSIQSAGMQNSHALSSLARANGLIDVPPHTVWEAGRNVSVMRWD